MSISDETTWRKDQKFCVLAQSLTLSLILIFSEYSWNK